MAANEQFTFFADVKQQLGVASVVITVPQTVNCPRFSVFVKEDDIEVKLEVESGSALLCRFTVTGISLQPTVFHSIQQDLCGCINLRLQLNRKYAAILQDTFCSKPKGEFSNLILWSGRADTVMKILRGMSYAVRCRMCAQMIIHNRKFHRVLPLSCELSEVSETWWCHQHDHSHNSDDDHNHDQCDLEDSNSCALNKPKELVTINPSEQQYDKNSESLCGDRLGLGGSYNRNGCLSRNSDDQICVAETERDQSVVEVSRPVIDDDECFVNDTFLVTDERCLQTKSFLMTDKRWIQCSRCRCIMGGVVEKTDVTCQKYQFLGRNQKYVQLMMHMLAVSCDDSVVMPLYSSKQLELELASYLLVERRTNNNFRFVIEMRNEDNKLIPVIVLCILDANAIVYQASSSFTVKENVVNPLHIIKLLYKDCLREQNKSTGLAWCHDLTVQSVELPEVMCLSILRILVDSTKSLPHSLRSVNDFYVGYLQRIQE